jgi:transcriptional regulator with XRE-family HTH domain
MPDTLGARLKQLRQHHGMSLRQLAQTAQVPASTLSAVERGTRAGANLTIATGQRLAHALGVTLDALADMEADAHANTSAPEDPPAATVLGPLCVGQHAAPGDTGHTLYMEHQGAWICAACQVQVMLQAGR